MKKVLLSILCLFPFLGAWCQSSEPWFYEGKQWAKLIWKYDIETELTITNVIQGSVEINGLTYWKVFESWKEDLSDLTFSGYYLREADRKVYWYEPDTEEEYLYMDFNLKKGDIFNHPKSDRMELCIIAAGDTILPQGDGISRKYMDVGRYYGDGNVGGVEEVWIEGIGSLRFGIGALCVGCTGTNSKLLCCHDAEKTLYMDEDNTCFHKILTKRLLYGGKKWAVWSPSATNPSEGNTVTSIIKNRKMLNEKSYYEVWSSRNEDLSDMKLAYYMREGAGNQFYVYNEHTNKEYLWFDFNLNVGDKFTFYTGDPQKDATATVVAITDTILPNGDDVKRKCFHLEPSYFGTMVESIGSLSYGIGKFNPYFTNNTESKLLCYHAENGELVYQSEEGTCYKTTGIQVNESDNSSVKVQCPEKGKLSFNWDRANTFNRLNIYSEDGSLYRIITITNENNQAIINNIPQGVYFYLFSSGDQQGVRGKVYVK